jgi:hypothetical protein
MCGFSLLKSVYKRYFNWYLQQIRMSRIQKERSDNRVNKSHSEFYMALFG